MTENLRRYPFPVRPLHHETIDSYSRRVLTANFEEKMHQNQHIRTYRASHPELPAAEAWFAILQTKTARDLSNLRAPSDVGHDDGTSCEQCIRGIETRHLCTLCAHGDSVEQRAHFDQNVCITHQRWVGPGAGVAEQVAVDASTVDAERRFRKLRRQRRIDAPFFMELRRALTGTFAPSADDAKLYVALVGLAVILTSAHFGRQLFDPSRSFASAFSLLSSAVRDHLGYGSATASRRLWLYLRPTFLTIRESVVRDSAETSLFDHDFPLHPAVLADLKSPMRPLEPFARYLDAIGDVSLTAEAAREFLEHRAATPPSRPRATPVLAVICRRGHRFDEEETDLADATAGGKENCPVCEGRVVQPGETSMAMTHPAHAQYFHPTANGLLTADMVFAQTHRTIQWRCADGHDFPASGTNFINAVVGCPVCLNRTIVLGVNCLPSKYPEIAREWHPTRNVFKKVDEVAAGSNFKAWWLCSKASHEFQMTVGDRTRGKNCSQCKTDAFLARSIECARPDWAAQWHPTANSPLTPSDLTAGSHVLVVWTCDEGHDFTQSPIRRASGTGCDTCSPRKVTSGMNDAQTRHPQICSEWHPYMNGTLTPDRILPGTTRYWWLCQAAGHKYQQSIPHRVASRGCPECPTDSRIGLQL